MRQLAQCLVVVALDVEREDPALLEQRLSDEPVATTRRLAAADTPEAGNVLRRIVAVQDE